MKQTQHRKKKKRRFGCSRQTNWSCESVLRLQHVRRTQAIFLSCCHTWRGEEKDVWATGAFPVNVRECCVCVSRQAAGPAFVQVTFLSPEKNSFVRSYRSCLARRGREGRGSAGLGSYKSELENHSSASVAYLHARSCQTSDLGGVIAAASCRWPGRPGCVNAARFCNCFVPGLSWDMTTHKNPPQKTPDEFIKFQSKSKHERET